MIINLLQLWEQRLVPEHRNLRKKKGIDGISSPSLDDRFMQSSFEFPQSPLVRFVYDIKEFKLINYYDQLPEFQMTSRESEALLELIVELKKNPKFFDGDQLLVTNMVYDDLENTVYVEAKRAKYSFLRALALKRFPEDSELYNIKLYKTGVMSPFITQDNMTFFFERSRDKLYSAASGFLEPQGKKKLLNPRLDLVVSTAIQETLEEILGINGSMRADVLFSLPQTCSLSIRQTDGGLATAEFVAPIFVKCNSSALRYIIEHNTAKDKDEHTDEYSIVDLNPSKRARAVDFLKSSFPGHFLYDPMLISASRMANHSTHGHTIPHGLPHTRTSVVPVKSLSSSPQAFTWMANIYHKREINAEGQEDAQSHRNSPKRNTLRLMSY